jgi:hypothetical protein
MKHAWLPISIVLALVVVAGIFVRQIVLRQPSAPGIEERALSTPSEEPPTAATSPVSTQSRVNGITLTVSSPVNNAAVTSASVTVRGKTVAGAEVFVNDVETRADSSGNFSVKFTLDEGENYILIVANDANGNYAEKDLTVTYTP